MAVSQAFLDMLKELLEPLGALSARRMFGGASLYCNGSLFALVDDDVLYLKADEATKARYVAEGSGPFTYDGQTGPVSMSYWRAPDRLFDEPDDMLAFAREAIDVAAKATMAKRAKKSALPKRKGFTAKSSAGQAARRRPKA